MKLHHLHKLASSSYLGLNLTLELNNIKDMALQTKDCGWCVVMAGRREGNTFEYHYLSPCLIVRSTILQDMSMVVHFVRSLLFDCVLQI